MTQARARVSAVGASRDIPSPDPIARDYILLALRLDQRIAGLVDGYFGPAELKAQVDLEQLQSPARLRDEARALLDRAALELDAGPRRTWLEAQLVALERQAADRAGEAIPYLDHVTACFDFRPERRPEDVFVAAARELDALLPGPGSTRDRLAAWDADLTIEPERLPPVVDWLVELFRGRASDLFGVPAGEALRVGLVRNQPWSGYNWYDGGLRSRVDLNLDLPIAAGRLVHVLAHETYPGHHLEHAWKEAERVDRDGQLEASVLLINTPECLISEGLADLGRRFAIADDEHVDVLAELFSRAGLALAADSAMARTAAGRQIAIDRAGAALDAAAINAAFLRHVDGAPSPDVQAYLERVALLTPERAAKRLEFIEHPLWRTYIHVYTEGEALLKRWLEQLPVADHARRFGRLLHEPLTPGSIVAEIQHSSAPDDRGEGGRGGSPVRVP